MALACVATAATGAVVAVEVGRVWRRGSRRRCPPRPTTRCSAAAEAVAETAEVARTGYREVSTRENAMFNLLTSFVTAFVTARDDQHAAPRAGQRSGRFATCGSAAATSTTSCRGSCSRSCRARRRSSRATRTSSRWLAIPFGVGMGLTLDESALLLELDDVYWSEEGIVSVQIALAVTALLAAVALATRFLRRGEQVVLEQAA